MALALAATAPALTSGAVRHAADQLTDHAEPSRVLRDLLARGANLPEARTVVEALWALHDLA